MYQEVVITSGFKKLLSHNEDREISLKFPPLGKEIYFWDVSIYRLKTKFLNQFTTAQNCITQ